MVEMLDSIDIVGPYGAGWSFHILCDDAAVTTAVTVCICDQRLKPREILCYRFAVKSDD